MVQVLCSYITLPLYALVTQMGSKYKSAMLEEHTIHALKQRHANVKHKRKINDQLPHSSPDDSTSTAVIRLSNSRTTDASTSHRSPEFVSSDEDEIVEIQTQKVNTSQIQNQHELD
ncbi:hypothetical protein AAHA92_08645 [Salvia divinorum]|uniref:Uncharacterized protein n=1 Tax=Salvia divinorum TaxID=28513 RepID=A0ABD1HPU9_SALDI